MQLVSPVMFRKLTSVTGVYWPDVVPSASSQSPIYAMQTGSTDAKQKQVTTA